jgi:hypothetical protein
MIGHIFTLRAKYAFLLRKMPFHFPSVNSFLPFPVNGFPRKKGKKRETPTEFGGPDSFLLCTNTDGSQLTQSAEFLVKI